MRRMQTPQMWHIRAHADLTPSGARPSENLDLPLSDEVPDFVARAVALGFDRGAARALYRRILSTGRDVRARRITPAGGVRRVERLALAVALVGGAS